VQERLLERNKLESIQIQKLVLIEVGFIFSPISKYKDWACNEDIAIQLEHVPARGASSSIKTDKIKKPNKKIV
jgi:hypothetical protein